MFIIILPTLDPFPNDWWNFSPCFPPEPRRKPLGWLRSQARPWLCAIRPCPENHPSSASAVRNVQPLYKTGCSEKKNMNGWMNYLKLCKLSELWNCNCFFVSVCVCVVFGGCAAVSPKNYLCQLPPPKGFACPSRIFERPPSASWFRARRSPGWFGWWSHFQKLVSLYPKRDDLGCLKTSPPGCFNSIHHQNFWSPNIIVLN